MSGAGTLSHAGAIASYVGLAPRLRRSGKNRFSGGPTIPFGNARLRMALWMVVLNAVRCNPWLRQYYERLHAAGKPGKVAVIGAMRKLLAAVWSVAIHRHPFIPYLLPTAATAGFQAVLIRPTSAGNAPFDQ
ncbi:MAG: IS110 family transposase [Candidatus Binataceae bacterium]